MIDEGAHPHTRRRFAPLGIISAVVGLLLFAYFIRKAGLADIIAGISRLGLAFLLILAISAVRHVVRSVAWTQCFERPHRLRFRDALAARLMGDALGNIIPIASMAVAEPSKVAFVRDRVSLMAGTAAIALENIFYGLSVVLFIAAGMCTLLLTFPLPKPLRYASVAALIATLGVTAMGYLLIHYRKRFLSGALSRLQRSGRGGSWITTALPRVNTLEDRIYGFYERNRARLLPIFALEVSFHLAGILEVYTTLSFISALVAPTLLKAFILESVNRVINVTFKFMPLRTGFDEAGTGMLSKALGFTTAIGVTLAIVRKGRDIFWVSIGLLLIARRRLWVRIPGKEIKDDAACPASDASASTFPD